MSKPKPASPSASLTPEDLPFRLVPGEAIIRLARIMQEGERRGKPENGWRDDPLTYHLDRALRHLALYLVGDDEEDHLGHALCRLAFMVAIVDQRSQIACSMSGEKIGSASNVTLITYDEEGNEHRIPLIDEAKATPRSAPNSAPGPEVTVLQEDDGNPD